MSFLSNQINDDFIRDIEFGWKLLFKGEWYTIIAPAYQLDGDKTSVSVDAVLSFFVDLNGHYMQDEVENKSFTPASFFSDLFTGTGYSFVLIDSLGANTFNYQRNQSKTERFLYAIDRFKGEYTIKGKVAYIYSLAGSDKDIILHDDLNIQDARVEVDASGFHTYARGYGDLDESKEDADYELQTEYESPLIAKYGKIEGPALYDGSFKNEPALKEAVKQRVENSYSISTTITPVDLTNNGYPEMQLEEGDRVYLHIDRLDLNQQVRVIEIAESFDVEGNIIDVQYTLGNESIAKRYKTQQYNTLKDFQDIIDGNKKIEVSWLDEAIKRAADIINGNLDSHFSYGPGEIIGINRSDPNGYMRFNTDGIGFSRDGGKTYRSAITYEGIVAESIMAGSIIGVNLASSDDTGYFHVSGSYAEFVNKTNDRRVELSPDGLYGKNSGGDIRFQADSSLVTSSAFGTSNGNVYLGSMPSGETRVVDYNTLGQSGEFRDYTYRPIRAAMFRFSHDIDYGYITKADGGEIRFTGENTENPAYVAIRSGRIFTNNVEVNGGSALYLRSDYRIRARGLCDTETFKPFEGSDFIQSSSRDIKENIDPYEGCATDLLCDLTIVSFDYIDGDKNRVGVAAEDSPQIADNDGKAVSLGDTIFLNTKAIQELNERLTKMEGMS